MTGTDQDVRGVPETDLTDPAVLRDPFHRVRVRPGALAAGTAPDRPRIELLVEALLTAAPKDLRLPDPGTWRLRALPVTL